MTLPARKRILLIDLNDPRRDTRVKILENAGYAVHVSQNHKSAEAMGEELTYDLILLALRHDKFKDVLGYSNRLQSANPNLPILLLSDVGVYVPRGTLSPSMETGHPLELIKEIAQMLTGGGFIQEMNPDAETFGQG